MKRLRPWFGTAMALSVFAGAPPARAHGPPAAVTGVVAVTGGEPRVVSVSEGLAQLVEGRWHYVCPAPFGAELSPPALSADGRDTFVVGQDDLFVLHADGTIDARRQSAFSRSFVMTLALVHGRVYAVRFDSEVTSVQPVDDASAPPIFEDARLYDSVTPDEDGFWGGWHSGTEGHAVRIEADPGARRDVSFGLGKDELVTRVAERAGALYVAVLTGALSGKLLRVASDGSSETVLEAAAPMIGPVTLAAGDGSPGFVVADGSLETLDTAPQAVATSDRATCLGRVSDFGYACERTKLFSLGPSGPGDLLVDLSAIEAPVLSGLEPEARDQCGLQWLVFQNDLRAIGVLPLPDASAPASSGDSGRPPPDSPRAAAGSGCDAGCRSPSDARVVGLLCGFVALIRRKRRVTR